MLMLVLVIAGLACAAVAMWAWSRRGGDVSRDADRFAAARAMTNRWAENPASAPKPVLDIARQRTNELPATPTDVDSDA